MRVAFWLFCLAMLAGVPDVCFADEPAAPTTGPAVEPFQNSTYGFTFQPPTDWIKVKSPNAHILAEFCVKDKHPDGTRAYLDSSVYGVPAGTTNAAIPARLKADPTGIFKDVQWTGPTDTTLGGEPAIELVQTSTNAKTGHRYKRDWVALIHDGKEYVFTYAAAPDQFDEIAPAAIAARKSFTWIAPVAAAATTRPADPMVVYQDPAKRFTISHPARWKPQKTQAPIAVQFMEPTDDPTAKFAANLNVTAGTLPGSPTIDAVFDGVLKAMPQRFTDFKLVSSQSLNVSGLDARRLEYTTKQNGLIVFILQVYTLNGDQMAVLTVAAPDDNLESYRSTIDAIVSSFELSKP